MKNQLTAGMDGRGWPVEDPEVEELVRQCRWQDAEALALERASATADALLGRALEMVLAEKPFRQQLRNGGADLGLRGRGCHPVNIMLPGGTQWTVNSPYFVPVSTMGRPRRKPGPAGKGRHLALDAFGFMDRTSPTLAFRALKLVVLSPSLDVASQVLREENVAMSTDKLRRLAACFDGLDGRQRVRSSSAAHESLAHRRVVISIDGGRIRERVAKAGRVPKGNKRRGYHAEWREPKLFHISVIDDDGNLCEAFSPQVDGCLGGVEAFKALLEAYAVELNLATAAEVIITGDGAKWLWQHIPSLLRDIGVDPQRITEVLDYTHAKQNLLGLFEHFTWRQDWQVKALTEELCDLLWQGNIEELRRRASAEAKRGCKRVLNKKLKEYFCDQSARFQYVTFRQRGVPCGSGAIESTIRRVVNLRIKSAGSFWLPEKAETMIFLRSKLLYNRWNHVKNSWQRDGLNLLNAADRSQDAA